MNTKDRDEKILKRLRTEEVTMADVARNVGLTRERVRQIVSEKYGENARSLGIIARRTCQRISREAAVKAKAAQKRTEQEDLRKTLANKVIFLRDRHWPQTKIATTLNISQSFVSQLLSEANHPSSLLRKRNRCACQSDTYPQEN